jgi:P-type Cu2+ transporter
MSPENEDTYKKHPQKHGEHQHHGAHADHRGHKDHEGHGGGHRAHHEHMVKDFKRRFWVSLVLTLPMLVLSPMLQEWLGLAETLAFPGDRYVLFALATAVFFYGGWPFLKGLFNELAKLKPGMMTLIGLAITVAYGYSSLVVFGLSGRMFFWELATLVDIMLLGHWLEMRSVMGASSALEELIKLMPTDAHRVKEGGEIEDVSVTDLKPDDEVLVKPGEKIPVDGPVTKGRTSVNQAMVTGESQPIEKGEGDEVIGGTINGDSAIHVKVSKTGEESYLSQVVKMVQEAQQSPSRAQNLADRAALWLTIIAVTAGVVTLVSWLIGGREFAFALERMVTVMVITCPHALGLAIPLVVAVSTAMSAKQGILIRDRAAFEASRLVDTVVFDKTGTLTRGEFGVSDVVALENHDGDEVLRLAAGLESQSEHPIGQGIVAAAKEKELEVASPEAFEAIPGKGAKATVEGKNVKVVSPGYLKEQQIEGAPEKAEALAKEGNTVVYVLVDDQPAGLIALADIVREESKEAVSTLRDLGIKITMITGDSEAVAQAVAKKLELDDYFAEVLPDKKASRIRDLKSNGQRVAMVGDGVNDAPALAEADFGLAIGAGTDVAMEAADVVLVNSDPRDVARTIGLANKTYRKMVQNLWWAAGYNIVAIPLAAGVLAWAGIVLSPAVGAILMSISTVIVAINAKLLGKAEAQAA